MFLGQNIDENIIKILKIHRTNLMKKNESNKIF